MTNIDHDALARRIAERLAFDRFIRQPSGMSGLETMLMVEQCIANVLREALPTSEEKSTVFDSLRRTLAESQLERATPILSADDVDDVPFDEPEDEES